MKLHLQNIEGNTIFHLAAMNGSIELISTMLDHLLTGFNLNINGINTCSHDFDNVCENIKNSLDIAMKLKYRSSFHLLMH